MTAQPCQQDALYVAQRLCPRGVEFSTPEETKVFLEEVLDHYPRWRPDFPDVIYVEVVQTQRKRLSTGRFDGQGGSIALADGANCARTALHELAHILADSRYGSAGHSPWYARIYLELVYVGMGSEAYGAMKASFDADGIDYQTDDAGTDTIRL